MLENLRPPEKNKGSCKVAAEAQKLSDSDKEIFLKAVADRENWPVKTLTRELRNLGIEISDSPITNHRSQGCACYR
jgi:hypothetical protein